MPADGTEPPRSCMIRFKTEIESDMFGLVDDEKVFAELARRRTKLC